MKVLVYSTKPFEAPLLKKANLDRHSITFTTKRLTAKTAMLAVNFDAVSIFSADDASETVLDMLRSFGVKYITLRSAGHDNVNLPTARRLGIRVANVPDYSPHAIAEHAIALLLALNRNICKAQNQTLNDNFLLDHLIGFDVHKKKIGVMGTGKIGSVLVKILHGFGCTILANDTAADATLISSYNVEYVSKEAICKETEIIFICLPLTTATHHLINNEFIECLEQNPIIINVARGAIVDTKAMLNALDDGSVSLYATDVYEKEEGIFFYDHSVAGHRDALLHRLLCHPRTLVTPHQAFATDEALYNIAETTLFNLNCWGEQKHSENEL